MIIRSYRTNYDLSEEVDAYKLKFISSALYPVEQITQVTRRSKFKFYKSFNYGVKISLSLVTARFCTLITTT